MIRSARLTATATATVLILGTVPAFADVTPREVWESWQTAYATMGLTMTPGSEAEDGDTLTLRDVDLAVADDDASVTGTIPEINLRDRGDGTVSITLSPEYEMLLETRSVADERFTATIAVNMPGLETIASGTMPTVTYDVTAPSIGIDVEGTETEGGDMAVDMTFHTVAATYSLSGEDDAAAQTFGYDLTAERLVATASVTPPEDVEGDADEGPAAVDIDWNVEMLRAQASGDLAALSPSGMSGEKAAALSIAYNVIYGPQTLGVLAKDADGRTFAFDGSGATGALDFVLADGRMAYMSRSEDVKMGLSGDAVPFPDMSASLDVMAVALRGPVVQTETPEDFAFNLNLDGLSVTEAVWDMFDPAKQLPRDPATLLIELAGKARLLVDLWAVEDIDPEAEPGELHALDLNALNLSAAGADLTGSGSFTFDNTDKTTFDGMPAADGALELKLTGGNALLDKLVAMGLLPQDQAMGARMMLGLFATPDGEDTLTSKIEVRPDGSVSANGQRLK